MTDAFVFVSRYEADAYAAKVGKPRAPVTIAFNGLRETEFEPVTLKPDARDFLFIGMMRALKGQEDFIRALAIVRDRTGHTPTAWMVGDGDEQPWFCQLTKVLGLGNAVTFRPAMPAREAFRMARTIVAPSRNESMPYLVLEALAAGKPTLTTRVGGIPEIYGEYADRLLPPADPEALATAMIRALNEPETMAAEAAELRASVRERFSIEKMAASVTGAYRGVVRTR
jgi:glycosyltransferase involved in cell wall biosynthesis